MRAVKDFIDKIPERPWILVITLIVGLGAWALVDFLNLSLARYSFYFDNIHEGRTVYESRALPLVPDREGRIALYVSEYLLGPATLEAEALFPEGTGVRSLMLRGERVLIDLDSRAAVPASRRAQVAGSLALLEKGIKRNFSFVEDVSLTIAGIIPQFRDPEGIQRQAEGLND